MTPRTTARRPAAAALVALALALAAGCGCGGGDGPPLVPVKGTVTHKGKPLGGMIVYFVPDPPDDGGRKQATGGTAADGTFTLRTGQDVGAAVGKYKVLLTAAETVESRALARYTSPGTTPLTVDVPAAGLTDYPLDLK